MDRKGLSLVRMPLASAPLRAGRSRRWLIWGVLAGLLLGSAAVMLALGPPPGRPDSPPLETLAWHTHRVCVAVEGMFAELLAAGSDLWSRSVIRRHWDVDSIVLVGAVVFIVGCAMLCRRPGR